MADDSPFLLKGYKAAVMVNVSLRLSGRGRAKVLQKGGERTLHASLHNAEANFRGPERLFLPAMPNYIPALFADKDSTRFRLVLSLIMTCASRITFLRDGGVPSLFRPKGGTAGE